MALAMQPSTTMHYNNSIYEPIADVEAAAPSGEMKQQQDPADLAEEERKAAQAVMAYYVGVTSSALMYGAAIFNQCWKQCRESNPDARDTLTVAAWILWLAWMWLNVDPVHGMRLDPLLLSSRCFTTVILPLTVVGACISGLTMLHNCTAGDVVFCVGAVMQLFVLTARFWCRRR
jgi:hypothetical protein